MKDTVGMDGGSGGSDFTSSQQSGRKSEPSVWGKMAAKDTRPIDERDTVEIPEGKTVEDVRPDGVMGGQGKSAHEISASSIPAGALVVGATLLVIVGLIIWFAKTSS